MESLKYRARGEGEEVCLTESAIERFKYRILGGGKRVRKFV